MSPSSPCRPGNRIWFLTILLLYSASLFGWSGHTHRKVVSDALSRMPQEFQDRFLPFKKTLMNGAVDPDRLIKDFHNHVYHVHTSRPETYQTAPVRMQEFFQTLIDLLKGNEVSPTSKQALKAFLDQSAPRTRDDEIAYQLGMFSHYIADLNQPLHTDGLEVDPAESEYHNRFERDVESQLSRIDILFTTPQPVTDVPGRLIEMVTAANASYRLIGEAYRKGNGIFDLKDLLQTQYSASVQQVVNHWHGVFLAASMTLSVSPVSTPGSSPALPELSLSVQAKPDLWPQPPVNLNSASLEELINLPGIGRKKAQAIMAARPFRSVYDLARVKGFGPALVEKLIDRLTIDP